MATRVSYSSLPPGRRKTNRREANEELEVVIVGKRSGNVAGDEIKDVNRNRRLRSCRNIAPQPEGGNEWKKSDQRKYQQPHNSGFIEHFQVDVVRLVLGALVEKPSGWSKSFVDGVDADTTSEQKIVRFV